MIILPSLAYLRTNMVKLKIPQAKDYYHIHIIFLLLFLYGYFQQNTDINLAHTNSVNINYYKNVTHDIGSPKYDQLVFVVIDAIREDFVTHILMPYTFKSATNNDCLFQVQVAAPTVTLPRIKTLTTGIVPHYFDMISNLWVSKLDSNNLNNSFLHSAKNSGKTMVFYGDDTWLHLYPDVFQRSEGTNSMFVNDFYEVDDNVTSNVRLEFLRNDWSFMFLHYLGLDHIGHVEGPKSTLISGKLLEMDSIIELIHKSLLRQNNTRTLIVVTGDHGMRDSGGHGGTSYAETHVPLVLLGQPCTATNKDATTHDETIILNLSNLHRSNIRQSDIPTSLALLYGLPIPPQSVGKFVPEFYGELSLKQRYHYCLYNQHVLFGSTEQSGNINNINWSALHVCESNLIDKTNRLGGDGGVGHILLLICCVFVQIIVLIKTIASLNDTRSLILSFLDLGVVCIYLLVSEKLNFYLSVFLLVVVVIKLFLSTKLLYPSFNCNYFTIFIIMFGHSFLLLCSTSYVEEEHQVYYYFFVTALLLLFYKSPTGRLISTDVLILIVFRFIKCLNQTGDQFISRPDVIDWFLQTENYIYSLLFIFTSFIVLVVICKDFYKSNIVLYSAFTALLSITIIYKLFYYNVNSYAQMLWVFIFLLTVINYFGAIRNCDNIVLLCTCISCLVSRPHNLFLIPFTIFMSLYVFRRLSKNNPYQIILHLILGQTMYFCSGFSNSLASVDVASGYIGISSYNPILVTLIVLCNTYCLPILSQILLLRNCDFSIRQMFIALVIDRMLTVIFVCSAAVIHIQHLFIWSVFAPKLLIESCHSIILWIFLILHECIPSIL